jgi:hypothetical protein
VGDVPHQADRQALQPALDPADGEDVEQALGRVLVGAVAGVDDAATQVLGQQVRRSRRGVADHHQVGPHRLDVLRGVDERLALGQAGAAGGEVDGVGAEPLGGQAEAGPGPCGRLEEQVDDDLALEVRQLLVPPLADVDVLFRAVENGQDFLAAELFQAEQMAAGPGADPGLGNGKFDGHDRLPPPGPAHSSAWTADLRD